MQPAELNRLSPGDKDFVPDLGTCHGGQLACSGVDRGGHDAARRGEPVDVPILGTLMGALHELRPDRERATGARKLEVAIVVESDPDYADQSRRKPGKPSVARGAGLTGRR